VRAVIAGAGGHARSVLAAARSAGELELVACTDPQATGDLDGVPIIGGDDALAGVDAEAAVNGVGGIGDNTLRAAVFARLSGFALPPVVHARAIVAETASLGPGTVVLAGAIVGPGSRLGANVIVNTGAIVEHDCVVADHVHIASGAVLGGDVQVADGAHVGLGATVLQGRRIGARAIVGAGAVVTRDVPGGVTAVGVPARHG